MDNFQNDHVLAEKKLNKLPVVDECSTTMTSGKTTLGYTPSTMTFPTAARRKSLSKAYSCSHASSINAISSSLFITPRQLVETMAKNLHARNCPCIPIIDCRSQIDFGCERMRTSHNVNCRAKLIARKLITKRLEDVEPNLSVAFEQSDVVILYDQSTDVLSDEQIRSLPIYLVVQAAKRSDKKVLIIQGGLDAIKSQYPHLVECVDETPRDQDYLPPSPEPIDKENVVMNEILPHIFVGNINDAENYERLKQHGISHVINATPDLPFCRELECKTMRVDVLDITSENILKHFESVFQFIDDALHCNSHNVFVHCSAGISRSPTLVLAYMIKKYHITLDDALKKMRRSRSIIDPNFSFIVQLRNWEKKCLSSINIADDSRSITAGTAHLSKPSSRYCGSTSTSKTDTTSHTDAAITVK